MIRCWAHSDEDAGVLSRAVEGHLNEFARDVISVGYSVEGGRHYVLAVYDEVEASEDQVLEAAVTVAEEIVEQAQA